jgi:hypothetical protein
MRLSLLLTFAISVTALGALGACGPKPRPPLDAASVPPGTGWLCYQHEEPGTPSVGVCFRDRDQCAARGTSDGGKGCVPADQAFCADLHPGGASHDVRCVATEEDCEELARNFEAQSPTQCAPAP